MARAHVCEVDGRALGVLFAAQFRGAVGDAVETFACFRHLGSGVISFLFSLPLQIYLSLSLCFCLFPALFFLLAFSLLYLCVACSFSRSLFLSLSLSLPASPAK